MMLVERFPRGARVRQRFELAPVPDLARLTSEIGVGVGALPGLGRWKPGSRVAVGVGSRGISELNTLVRTVVETVRGAGHRPFVLPAMGSHGGATEEGQRALLADLGVTEANVGAPIESGMGTRVIGMLDGIGEIHLSEVALDAGAVILINRVKPHTDFGGALGSGLLKMAVVGLGKHPGALGFHRASLRVGYCEALRAIGGFVLGRLPNVAGVAVVEDPLHRIARVEIVSGEGWLAAEERLVLEARRLMPSLPMTELDLLIVDRMGKDISGAGMDPNVIGRTVHGYSLLESEMGTRPRIRRVLVRDLSAASHGNAIGIGLADFTTTRLVRAIDARVTYTNAVTALSLQGAKIPVHYPSDREAIAAALSTLGVTDPSTVRLARIADTLTLGELWVSEASLEDLSGNASIEVSGELEEMRFDGAGDLI